MADKITTDALNSVTDKLHQFAEGLSDDERTVLDVILAKAAQEDEVSGFSFASFTSFGTGTATFDPSKTRQMLSHSLIGDIGKVAYWELIIKR